MLKHPHLAAACLQLRLTPPACRPHPLCSRLRGHDAGGGGGEAGPASGGSGAVEGPVRIKYRSTLTEENVGYLNKLDQYASRPDYTGRSSGASAQVAICWPAGVCVRAARVDR